MLLTIVLPSVSQAQKTGSIRLVDDAGQMVVLARPARRVVSLAPNLTELLFAAGAGDSVVGTSRYSDFPDAAKRIPIVGDAVAIDLERIVSLKPDLIVVWLSGNSPALTARLKVLRIPIYYSEPQRMHHIPKALRDLGVLTGNQHIAERSARAFQQRSDQLRRQYSNRQPLRVFFQVWDQPLMTVGGEQIISDAIAICGGINVFARLKLPAPTVTPESVLATDPDVIVSSDSRDDGTDGLDRWHRLHRMRASHPDRLIALGTPTLGRQSPRVLDGTEMLCKRLQRVRALSGAKP